MDPQTLPFGQGGAKGSLASQAGLGKHDFVHFAVCGSPLHIPGDEGGGGHPHFTSWHPYGWVAVRAVTGAKSAFTEHSLCARLGAKTLCIQLI